MLNLHSLFFLYYKYFLFIISFAISDTFSARLPLIFGDAAASHLLLLFSHFKQNPVSFWPPCFFHFFRHLFSSLWDTTNSHDTMGTAVDICRAVFRRLALMLSSCHWHSRHSSHSRILHFTSFHVFACLSYLFVFPPMAAAAELIMITDQQRNLVISED